MTYKTITKSFSGERIWLFKHQTSSSILQITARTWFCLCLLFIMHVSKSLWIATKPFLFCLSIHINYSFVFCRNRSNSFLNKCCRGSTFNYRSTSLFAFLTIRRLYIGISCLDSWHLTRILVWIEFMSSALISSIWVESSPHRIGFSE